MESALTKEKEIENEKLRFSIHVRSFEVLFHHIGREKLDRLMFKVWQGKANELAEKMSNLDFGALSSRIVGPIQAAQGVLKVMGNDDNMSTETFKGLSGAIYKLGQFRISDPFPSNDADWKAVRLLHEIEMVDFADYSEGEILEILASGSEGEKARTLAESIKSIQGMIADAPATASARFDELMN